jgi:hypothetical protein
MLLDPSNFYIPFYVGKGCNYRAKTHLYNSKNKLDTHKQRKINKIRQMGYEPTISYWKTGLSNEEAVELEIELISRLGRSNNKTGILTNLTNGGEGTSGWMPDQKWLDRHNELMQTGILKPPSEAAIKNSAIKRKGVPLTESHKQKLSAKMIGREFSSETRRKISEAKSNPSLETREKMSKAQSGKVISQDTKKKMSETRTDKTIICWIHPHFGIETCSRQELISKYPQLNLRSGELGKLLSGIYKTHKGWSLITNQ